MSELIKAFGKGGGGLGLNRFIEADEREQQELVAFADAVNAQLQRNGEDQ